MKEAIVYRSTSDGAGLTVKIHDVPIPKPGPDQILIKIHVSGSNPKDWKLPLRVESQNGTNQGDDIAGVVSAVGPNVSEFKAGDRVAAFHEMTTPNGSYAEYGIAWAHTTFHIPETISFEQAATIPLAAMTSAVGLYTQLNLPEPWQRAGSVERERARGGVVVYGAAGAVGAYAIQLLQKSDIHPIIAVAGRGADFVRGLIDESKGDVIVDYRQGDDAVVQGLKNGTAKGEKLRYAYDAVADHNSYQNISKALDTNKSEGGSALTVVTPGKNYDGIPDGVRLGITTVGVVHKPEGREFGHAWFRLFSLGLKEGWFKPHPHEVVPGGLAGVQQALTNLKNGKASAVKYVFRIEDTEGAEKSQ